MNIQLAWGLYNWLVSVSSIALNKESRFKSREEKKK